MRKDQRVQVQFDIEMATWLKTLAERRRCSLAQAVREVVLEAMEKPKRR